jgi:hypothetical protein
MSLFCRLSLLPPRRAPGASSVRGAHLIAMAVASSSGSPAFTAPTARMIAEPLQYGVQDPSARTSCHRLPLPPVPKQHTV